MESISFVPSTKFDPLSTAWRSHTHKVHILANAQRHYAYRLATRNGLNSLDSRGSRVGIDIPDRVRRLLALRSLFALWRKRTRDEAVARAFYRGWALRRVVMQWREWSVEEMVSTCVY